MTTEGALKDGFDKARSLEGGTCERESVDPKNTNGKRVWIQSEEERKVMMTRERESSSHLLYAIDAAFVPFSFSVTGPRHARFICIRS